MTATGVVTKEPNLPRTWIKDASGNVRAGATLADLTEALANPTATVWVDIDSTVRSQFALLEKVFRFHPLAIEDALHPNSRVKLDEYEGYLFLIIRGVEFEATTPEPHDLKTSNLCCFLGKNFLVTVHAHSNAAVNAFADRCTSAPETIVRGPARVMYAILDGAVDAYFPVLDQVNEFIDGLEERVFTSYDQDALQEIFSLKRTMFSVRRHLVPAREVFNSLANRPSALLSLDEQRYFRDIYDHVLRINDSIEQYRDLLSSVLEASLTQTSNRLGMVTKGLTVVATISVPFVVVSGMWGMNFVDVPLSHWPHGFWVMMAIQLGLGGLLLLYVRKKGWL